MEIGDKVLLANRRERARGKLADLWDSTVFVTWKNPNVHVYKVEDPVIKKNKVVHRNFMLPVNFLPTGQSDTESTVLSTLSNDESDMEEPDPKEAPRHVDEDYDDQRTAAWVLQTEGPEIQPHDVSRADA